MSGKDMFKKDEKKAWLSTSYFREIVYVLGVKLDGYWRNFFSSSSSTMYVGERRRGRGGERLDGNRGGEGH